MGMFDSLFDAYGHEWQTKAFDCALDEFQIGDPIPADCAATFQVEILRGEGAYPTRTHTDSYATVRGGVLASVHDRRDPTLPLLDYGGRLVAPSKGL